MFKSMRWLPYLNIVLVMILVCVGVLFFFYSKKKDERPDFSPYFEEAKLPENFFIESKDYDLEKGPFSLEWVPPLMLLPDLKGEIQFFGQNGRPDAARGKAAYHIGLKSSGECRCFGDHEPIYLVYEANFTDTPFYQEQMGASENLLWGDVVASSKGNYFFSKNNEPSSLWLEICSSNNHAIFLRVNMLDEKNNLVTTPQQLHQITLQAQKFPKAKKISWEIGGHRADSTLLARQKARWMGSDRFLEIHGGEDYSFAVGRERIDFQVGEETAYSCYIGLKDFLIWKGDRWVTPMPEDETEGFPLLCIRKMNEKILSLELWDASGRSKTALNLIRSKERSTTPDLSQELKFIGAKTWAQFIVECRGGTRLILRPNDWLVLTQDGWQKLDTPDQIDAYVDGSISGPLFVLDNMTKQNGTQMLVGHFFNTSRTVMKEIELEASSTTSLANFYPTKSDLVQIADDQIDSIVGEKSGLKGDEK